MRDEMRTYEDTNQIEFWIKLDYINKQIARITAYK